MAGSPVVNYAMNFSDTPRGQWCSKAIRWAASEDIVGGYGNGSSDGSALPPQGSTTRAQLAVMLYRRLV